MLAIEEDNPNRANVRFLIDNAAMPAGLPTATSAWCCCSTATMTDELAAARGALGRLQGARTSRSPIGRPTSGAAGSGGKN